MLMTIDSSAGRRLARFGLTEGDVDRLVEALGNRDPHARWVVRGAIRGLGECAEPALRKGIQSRNSTVREEAERLLALIDRVEA